MTNDQLIEKANASLTLSDVYKFNEAASEQNTPLSNALASLQTAYVAGYARGYKEAVKDAKNNKSKKAAAK